MKLVVQNIVLLLLAGLLVAGILWAQAREERMLCQRLTIEIENRDSTQFVTERGVQTALADNGIKVLGRPMRQIDASHIERVLGQSDYLENVECIKAKDGEIIIRATQLVPVLRVFDADGVSYYVNAAGKRMNATATFHADVPVVQGHFTDAYPATRLLPLVQHVESDTLLRSLVAMYTMRDSNNIFITPTIVGHVVNLGSVSGFESKLEKLKLFYREVMPAKGWETYDTISVKWNHQVVATKRKKTVREVMVYDPEEDEVAPDMETMAVGDTTLQRQATPKKQEASEPQAKKKEPQAKKKEPQAKKEEPKKKPEPQAKKQEPKKKTEPQAKKKETTKPQAAAKAKTGAQANKPKTKK